MKAPVFWWLPKPSLTARLLMPLGAIYGDVTARRMARRGKRAAIPVICVGNLVAGGAGKTPTAILIATMLRAIGRNPVFLSRGYGGRLAGPLRVDSGRHDAADVGDEPLLLARTAPAIISRDRVAGVALAIESGADVVVMDDGLQNPSLEKDLALAVVDGAAGIGNGLCIPAGPLRAPLAGQFSHTDAVLVIGSGLAGETVARLAREVDKSVFTARLAPDAGVAARLQGRSVLAFAGIGRPEKFFASLRELGAEVVVSRAFDDHAPLTAADAQMLLDRSTDKNLMLVTTEKDMVRMQGRPELAALRAASLPLPVQVQLGANEEFQRLLARALLKPRFSDAP